VTARLRVVAGGHELLLDSAHVQRVWTADSLCDEVVEWQGRDIPLIDLAVLLSDDAPPDRSRIVVVYGDEANAIGLAVDAVRGLVPFGANGIAALPRLSEAFVLLFEGIAVEPIEGRHLLCLRSLLDAAALAAASRARRAERGVAAHG
jgi:chemotaxis signal transduction protein